MNGNRGRNEAAAPNGSLLRLGDEREVAIYQRDGVSWIADFRGGRGELFTVGEWFALNRGRSVSLRAARCPITHLPAVVIERIERLHGAEDRAPMAALGAHLRDGLARVSQALSCRAPAGALSPRMQRS